jgi:PAS domain S-box-containing protein
MEQLHGLSGGTFGGTVDAFFGSIHPDDRQRVRERVAAALQERGEFRVEYRVASPQRLPRWVNLVGRPVHDATERVTGAAGVGVDITDQKALEEQFRHAQRMDSIGSLAGGIAHDFNNLLTAILGFSNLLLEEPAVIDGPAHVRADVDQIRQAGQRAAALTNQLLAFSRKQILQPAVLNTNPIIVNLEPMLRRLIGADIVLTTQLADDLGSAFADVGQIEQVIMNLVVNARDAMPGGGRITIDTANVELGAAYAARRVDVTPGRYVMLAVSDTGEGMAPGVQARIFEPFFTTKPAGRGTGLGLATLFGIVKQHEGHIGVYSELGQGTTFKIYFPRVSAESEKRVAAPVATLPSRGETVLLVDDDAAIRLLAHQVLTCAGYRVLEAADGRQATAMAAAHDGIIHLLVTDVVMPDINGRALAHQLIERRPDIKVLFMSGYTSGAVLHHGVLAAGVAFLQKPFTPAVFTRAVREVLDTGDATARIPVVDTNRRSARLSVAGSPTRDTTLL